MRPCGIVLPIGDTIVMHYVLLHGVLQGENPILLWMCDDDTIGVMPFLEARHLESSLARQWWWFVDGVACARRHLRCTWSMLV
jgi:hypothetical protein